MSAPSYEPLQFVPALPMQDVEPVLKLADALPANDYLIDDPHVQLLNRTTIIEQWSSRNGTNLHQHQVQEVEMDGGWTHSRLHTEPAEYSEPQDYEIVNFLGWTESIDGPIVRKTHSKLAELHPGVAVTTEATYGMAGSTSLKSFFDIAAHGLDAVAKHSLDVMAETHPQAALIVTATSLNAGVLARVKRLNNSRSQPVEIVGEVLYEPFLLTEEQAGWSLVPRFGAHIVADYAGELLTHTAPHEIPQIFADAAHSSIKLRELPAVLALGVAVLAGTNKADIDALSASHAVIVHGTNDCLNNAERDADTGFIDMVVDSKGHAMGLHPAKRAKGLSNAIEVVKAVKVQTEYNDF